MAKKKQLILDPTTGKLSRLKSKDLSLIGISGLNEGSIISFGTLETDVIEFHLYDVSDNYIASGEIPYPLPDRLDIGAHVRSLGYERGTYKIVYNFLRQIGGSNKVVITKKSDKTIYTGEYWIDTDGKIYAGTLEDPLKDDDGNFIELFIQENKFWIQELSPSRTEMRLRPNPGINDENYSEQFRLLGYDCLSYSDISGNSYMTFGGDGKNVTIDVSNIILTGAMNGGTLIIREAFIIDYEGTPEVISRYVPTVETETVLPSQNLVTNGHFFNGTDISENSSISDNHEIIIFPNPGNSAWCLKTTSNDSNNQYEIILDGIPGETYIMSCWVHWGEGWPEERRGLFRGKINSGDGFQSIENQYPPYDVVEEKMVDGKIWSHQYKIITISENSNGTIKWFLGKTNLFDIDDQDSIRYITNIQFEPGSIFGKPSLFMISPRIEDTDIPVTGLITFGDDGKTLTAIFSDEDDGFVSEMISDSNGRESGKITIKDAFVIDEVFSEDTEVIVIDDIPLKNPLATDIKKYEREFLVSPFHGSGNNKIILRVDNNYTITSFASGSTSGSVVGSSVGVAGAYRESYTHNLPDDLARLEILTHNGTEGAGFIAKIFWNGSIIKTGDGRASYENQVEVDWRSDTTSHKELNAEDISESITLFTESSGPWEIISNDTNPTDLNWKKAGSIPSNIHNQLKDCDWIWSNVRSDNQDLVWTWTAESSVVDLIWQYWDPILHSDAVKPEGWGAGFNAFNWGGDEDRKNDKSRWHSGWLGYHAKWVEGEGQHGDTCMKFIDHNSEFGAPNHTNYPLSSPYRTGFVNSTDNPDELATLAHRWLGIAQILPHTMAAQGIEPGDNITISWWQKSDIFGKGAMVGLRHFKLSDGNTTWGNWIRDHPATLEEGMQRAGEREFRRYIPCSKVGEWEQVSYTAEVEDDWDLTKSTRVYVYGQYGPEGILWVENVQVQLTTTSQVISRIPVTADLVAEIDIVENKNTVILKDTYDNLAPEGIVTASAANIRPWNIFTEFYVDYTSSLETRVPIYGSLRGEIESVSGTTLTLVNSYEELGNEIGHDFENIFDVNQNLNFDKWFIQYEIDSNQDLSKLLNFGQNHLHLITNFKIDTVTYPEYPYSVLYKLYEPLPGNIEEHDFCYVVREMIPPVEEICTLIPFIEEEISDIVLRIPEFSNVNSPIGLGSTEFKNYGSLTSTDITIKKKLEDEILSGSLSADINVDYSQFAHFIHFGSAEKRLKNFKYKLDLIEQYTDRSASLAGAGSGTAGIIPIVADPVAGAYLNVSGSESLNPPYQAISGSLVQIQSWEQKRRDTINTFDKFEKYMFKQSSSYSSESIGVFHDNAWPKRSGLGTYSDPYVLARTSQSIATTWYANQLISASVYDRANKNRVRSHLPMFVQDDDENTVFLNFVDMIGHYFDDIWVFIKAMTDIHDKRDKLTEGIALMEKI